MALKLRSVEFVIGCHAVPTSGTSLRLCGRARVHGIYVNNNSVRKRVPVEFTSIRGEQELFHPFLNTETGDSGCHWSPVLRSGQKICSDR